MSPEEWITTSVAAELLGTSTTTVRSLADSGDLEARVDQRRERRRWKIRASSVHAYLERHGRVDDRRSRTQSAAAPSGEPLARLLGQRDQLRSEVASLRLVALRLRARNDALDVADRHQTAAATHLRAALDEEFAANAALRQALESTDDALGQFLLPDLVPPTPGAANDS